jgi:hypothetical protein
MFRASLLTLALLSTTLPLSQGAQAQTAVPKSAVEISLGFQPVVKRPRQRW